jgi:two-component system cell cycle response regulator
VHARLRRIADARLAGRKLTLPPTVLVIDDCSDIHALLQVRLKPEGLHLVYERDPEAGVRRARAMMPDLILLDVMMPAVSGFEVCRQLKELPETAAIPVIFLSGTGETVDKVAGFDAGAVDYVTKPFDPAELRARVRAALRTKRYHDLLATRAQVDALTGLWNRAYFDRRLQDELAAVQRYGRAVSLILVDIDAFKRLNDGFGHPFGDRVLHAVADAVQSCVRQTDAACRYGGEELGLILTETERGAAIVVAERARALIASLAFSERGRSAEVTASFGVACSVDLPEPVRTTDALLVAADAALYRAKHRGKNRVEAAGRPSGRIDGRAVAKTF